MLQEKRQGVLVLWDDVFTPPVIHTGTDTRVSLETNKQTNKHGSPHKEVEDGMDLYTRSFLRYPLRVAKSESDNTENDKSRYTH